MSVPVGGAITGRFSFRLLRSQRTTAEVARSRAGRFSFRLLRSQRMAAEVARSRAGRFSFRALAGLIALAAPSAAFAQHWETRTLSGMNVHIYTPASPGRTGSGRGLIIGLHGCTQSNDALRDQGHWEPSADAYGIVIALPKVPNGGVLAGCWDYYGSDHTRSNRHNGPLLGLVEALAADRALAIDRNQVYITGLSSGAGEAFVMACLAPDVFAGVGINAGPPPGTTAAQATTVSTDVATAQGVCARLAGTNADRFATQLASVIAGSMDFIVAQGYGRMDAQVLAALYAGGGASLTESMFSVEPLAGYQPHGQGTLWSDPRGPRVSQIVAQGMGHAFPAGSGAGQERNFIASAGVSWPDYLARFFTDNNRRIARAPTADAGGGGSDGGLDSGRAGDARGSNDGGAMAPGADGGANTGPDGSGGCACTAAPAAPLAGLGPTAAVWVALLALSGMRRSAVRIALHRKSGSTSAV